MVLGDTDFVLLVATRSIEEYNEFIQKRLSQIEGVHAIESRMVLEETKHTTELPLQLLGLRAGTKSGE
jgi:DNA-binding Lrp family transcriptional regulator